MENEIKQLLQVREEIRKQRKDLRELSKSVLRVIHTFQQQINLDDSIDRANYHQNQIRSSRLYGKFAVRKPTESESIKMEIKIKYPSTKEKIINVMSDLTNSKIPLCGMYYSNETKDIVANIRNVLAGSQLKRLEELITNHGFKFLINFESKKIKIFEKNENKK